MFPINTVHYMMIDVSHCKMHIIAGCVRLYTVLVLIKSLFCSSAPFHGICSYVWYLLLVRNNTSVGVVEEQFKQTCTSQLNGEGDYMSWCSSVSDGLL